jgi:3-methyl-2-oxobutanoate hydroxymethyltransferase
VQGRDEAAAQKLVDDAVALEQAGVFSIVLEAVPAEVAKRITESVSVPTIGIGAGPHCDGQVLVTPDLLGLFERFVPKFVKRYAHLAPLVEEAVKAYIEEVKSGAFPSEEHLYK